MNLFPNRLMVMCSLLGSSFMKSVWMIPMLDRLWFMYVVLYCYVVLFCAVLCCAGLCWLCCVVLCCVVMCWSASYRIVSYRIVSYRIVSYRMMTVCSSVAQFMHHTITLLRQPIRQDLSIFTNYSLDFLQCSPTSSVGMCIVLCCVVLHCVVLLCFVCIVLYCIVLYCVTVFDMFLFSDLFVRLRLCALRCSIVNHLLDWWVILSTLNQFSRISICCISLVLIIMLLCVSM